MRKHRNQRRKAGFLARLAYAFRERQIYLRSEGEVQFITLRPSAQIFGLLILLAALFWTAYATVNVAFKDQLLILKEQRMYQTRLDYEDKLAAMRRSIDALNQKLLLDQKGYLAKVDEVKAEFDALVRRHERIVQFFREGWFPLKDTPDGADTAPGAVRKTGFDAGSFQEKYAADFRSPEDVLRPLADLRTSYSTQDSAEADLLGAAEAYVHKDTAAAASVFARLGIEPAPLLQAGDGEGGPFVPVTLSGPSSARAMESVRESLARLEKVKSGLAALPLVWPMARPTRISSTFGVRNDPFRRTAAMHQGVDFKAAWAEPVLATADGVVIKAGWEGGYGKLVEIMHDNGVSTRYGHLSSIGVSPGQRVKRWDVVGRMGSTGRSTGPHLHYETRVRGEPIDPDRFWQARNDLQALRQKEN